MPVAAGCFLHRTFPLGMFAIPLMGGLATLSPIKRGIALAGAEPVSCWSGTDTRHENLASLAGLPNSRYSSYPNGVRRSGRHVGISDRSLRCVADLPVYRRMAAASGRQKALGENARASCDGPSMGCREGSMD